jgi:uncharacterized protein YybS (DUF2232 family)
MAAQPFQKEVSRDVAAGVAATLTIFAVSIIMPVVGFAFSIFIPLPVLFYRAKLGRRNGMIVPLAAAAVMSVVFGGVTMDIFFFSGLMLLGFAMSEMFEKTVSVEATVAIPCTMVLGAGLVVLILYSIAANQGLGSLVAGYVATNVRLSLELYEGIGMPQETIDAITGSLDQIQYVLVRILPSMAAVSVLFVAWTNLITVRPLMARHGLYVPDFGPLDHWRAPEPLVWGVIGCGLCMLLPATDIRLIGVNGLLVLLTLYFFQGIAIVSFYFKKKNLPRPIRVILYTMIAFQQLLLLAIVCLGLFDMWINFRKIDKNKQKPNLPQ